MTVDGDAFRGFMRCYPTGVVVITAAAGGETRGMTAGSFTSVSLVPPLICFNVMKSARFHAIIADSPRFAISVLADDQAELSDRFARPGLEAGEQFEGVRWRPDGAGLPLIDGALGWMSCAGRHRFDCGDHTIFVGEVLAVENGREGSPLVYQAGGYRTVGEPARRR